MGFSAASINFLRINETLDTDGAWKLWQACSGNGPRPKSPAERDLAHRHQERIAVAVRDTDQDTLARLINAYADEHPLFLEFIAKSLKVEKE